MRIVKMARAMPKDIASEILARQVIRSGTSIGANIAEAQGAQSKREFARRMCIARSEARETHYWLRLIGDTGLLPATRLNAIIEESEAILKILVVITRKARGE